MYSVLIPAYNAAKTLNQLLIELKELSLSPAEIIVVNDGSTDETKSIAENAGIVVYNFPENMGKGEALKKGFEHFKNGNNSNLLICMDADLQHPTQSIAAFLESSKENSDAVLIGKRHIALTKMPFARYVSNTITSFILSRLSGYKVMDSQCGFRLIPKSVLKKLGLNESGFQLESEFILRCADENIPLEFVDIPTIYNKNGSNISHIADTYKFIKFVLKEIFKR